MLRCQRCRILISFFTVGSWINNFTFVLHGVENRLKNTVQLVNYEQASKNRTDVNNTSALPRVTQTISLLKTFKTFPGHTESNIYNVILCIRFYHLVRGRTSFSASGARHQRSNRPRTPDSFGAHTPRRIFRSERKFKRAKLGFHRFQHLCADRLKVRRERIHANENVGRAQS